MISEPAQEPAVRLVGRDQVAEGTPSWRIRYAALAGPAHSSSPPLDEDLLAAELWQISHFGWIPEGAIRRSLSVAAGQEFPASALATGLDRLVERGWIQQQQGEPGTGEREWRLTDAGRDSLPSRARAVPKGVLPWRPN